MFAVFCRFPAGIQRMAILAAGRKDECFVIWVCCRSIVRLMARIALRRNFRIATRGMATGTVVYSMTAFERENEWFIPASDHAKALIL